MNRKPRGTTVAARNSTFVFFRPSQPRWRIASCHLAIGPTLDVANS